MPRYASPHNHIHPHTFACKHPTIFFSILLAGLVRAAVRQARELRSEGVLDVESETLTGLKGEIRKKR